MSQPAPPNFTADITNQSQTDLPLTQERPLESSLQPARDKVQPEIRPVTCSHRLDGLLSAQNSYPPLLQSTWMPHQSCYSSQNFPPPALRVRSALLTCPPPARASASISVGVPAEPKLPALLRSLAITFSYDVLYCKSQKAMSANRSRSCTKGKC